MASTRTTPRTRRAATVTTRHAIADDPVRAADLAEILKAVAHPLRLRIVAILCQGECHVNALAGRLGVPQALVSQHLSTLRLLGLVAAERRQGLAVYRIAEERLHNLVECVDGCRTH